MQLNVYIIVPLRLRLIYIVKFCWQNSSKCGWNKTCLSSFYSSRIFSVSCDATQGAKASIDTFTVNDTSVEKDRQTDRDRHMMKDRQV